MKHYSSILSENRHINRLIKFIIVSTCLLSFQSSYATYLQFKGSTKDKIVRFLKKSKTHQSVSPHLNGSLKSVVVDINRVLKKLEPSPANLDRIIDFQTTLNQMLSHLRVDEINYIETETFAANNIIILDSIQQKTKELEQKKQTGAVPKAKHMSETKLGLALQQGLPEKQIQIPAQNPKLPPYENSGYGYSIPIPGMSKQESDLLNSVQDETIEDSDTSINKLVEFLRVPCKQLDTTTSRDPAFEYDEAKETSSTSADNLAELPPIANETYSNTSFIMQPEIFSLDSFMNSSNNFDLNSHESPRERIPKFNSETESLVYQLINLAAYCTENIEGLPSVTCAISPQTEESFSSNSDLQLRDFHREKLNELKQRLMSELSSKFWLTPHILKHPNTICGDDIDQNNSYSNLGCATSTADFNGTFGSLQEKVIYKNSYDTKRETRAQREFQLTQKIHDLLHPDIFEGILFTNIGPKEDIASLLSPLKKINAALNEIGIDSLRMNVNIEPLHILFSESQKLFEALATLFGDEQDLLVDSEVIDRWPNILIHRHKEEEWNNVAKYFNTEKTLLFYQMTNSKTPDQDDQTFDEIVQTVTGGKYRLLFCTDMIFVGFHKFLRQCFVNYLIGYIERALCVSIAEDRRALTLLEKWTTRVNICSCLLDEIIGTCDVEKNCLMETCDDTADISFEKLQQISEQIAEDSDNHEIQKFRIALIKLWKRMHKRASERLTGENAGNPGSPLLYQNNRQEINVTHEALGTSEFDENAFISECTKKRN